MESQDKATPRKRWKERFKMGIFWNICWQGTEYRYVDMNLFSEPDWSMWPLSKASYIFLRLLMWSFYFIEAWGDNNVGLRLICLFFLEIKRKHFITYEEYHTFAFNWKIESQKISFYYRHSELGFNPSLSKNAFFHFFKQNMLFPKTCFISL